MTTALIADDEPLLRTALEGLLKKAWPELRVVAQARNGREALELFEALHPDVCFLDIRMPGVSGIEAAQGIGRRAHIVFVTAYDDYAVKAFEAGVIDYIVKPVGLARISETAQRLKERIAVAAPAPDSTAVLEELLARLGGSARPAPTRWLNVQVGNKLRMIAAEDIDYLRSEAKYTLVAWRDGAGRPAEALVSTPLKELVARLDPEHFVQVHRAVAVNVASIDYVVRSDNETGVLHLKGRTENLPVSRARLPMFRGL